MGMASSLKKGFSIAGMAVPLYLCISVYNIVMGLIMIPTQMKMMNANAEAAAAGRVLGPEAFTPDLFLMVVFQVVVGLLIFPAILGGLISFSKSILTSGQDVEVFPSFFNGVKSYASLIGMWLLFLVMAILGIALVLIVAAIPMMIAGAMAAKSQAAQQAPAIFIISSVIIFLVLMTIYSILYIFLAYTPYEIVTKQKSVFSSIAGSVALVKRNFWSTIWMTSVLFIIGLAVGLSVQLGLAGLLALVIKNNNALMLSINVIIGSLIGSYVLIYSVGALTDFYSELDSKQTQDTVTT